MSRLGAFVRARQPAAPRGRSRRLRPAGCFLALTALAAGACSGAGAGGKDRLLVIEPGQSGQYVNNFNPFSTQSMLPSKGEIYEPLFFFNTGRTEPPRPLLATGYSFTSGGRKLNLTLREGVTWSDGKPFSATDVAYTFNLMAHDPKLNQYAVPITGATAVDATHVTVDFGKVAYTQLWYVAGLTFIVPEHIWKTVKDPSTFTDTKPVGTGPFTLKTFTPQAITIVKNTGYWEKGKPAIPGVRYVTYSSNAGSAAALMAGQLDVAGIAMANMDQFLKKSTTHHIAKVTMFITNLEVNNRTFPTDDLAVRRAISLGIDRDAVNRLAVKPTAGLAANPASPAQLVLPQYQSFLSPQYKDLKFGYDPAAAEQALTAGGYTKGSDGYYRKGGRKVSLTAQVIAGYTDQITVLQVISQQLKKIGIEVKTQQESPASFFGNRGQGRFQMLINNDGGGSVPFYTYKSLLYSKSVPGATTLPNPVGFSDPAVDAALDTIETTDPKNTAALQRQYDVIEKAFVDKIPYIGLLQPLGAAEYLSTHLSGFPTEDNLYANPAPYQGPDNAMVLKNITPSQK
ncbi:ABC transporter substrate-binding protein [Streptomyces sp. CA-111067]|uniref:ABC transporter substrate-binding protein n=1 Tax=Streptomyces sp. CA-111067 TaxID=3240046 RepID=UPI003D974FCA